MEKLPKRAKSTVRSEEFGDGAETLKHNQKSCVPIAEHFCSNEREEESAGSFWEDGLKTSENKHII